jgi:penicillin amidase
MRRRVFRLLNLAGAFLATLAVFWVSIEGYGPLPPLGPVASPVTGFWRMARDSRLPHGETLRVKGLEHLVRVSFEANGTAHIDAGSDHDLWLALGYVHARFRLFQMDLARRQGAGRLAEIVGHSELESDTFELELGLERTAQATWNALPAGDPSREALLAYAQGVNARIDEAVHDRDLPVFFKLLDYRPRPWRPVDSLVIQGVETQLLGFTDTPLDAALLVRSLGRQRVLDWFPVLPPNRQEPYAPGPYRAARPTRDAGTEELGRSGVRRGMAVAAAALRRRLATIPRLRGADSGNSNSWVVSGRRTASGEPILSGDPHLPLSLPSIWYQVDLVAPGYRVAGASIPGLPGVLIGRNQHIAWSLTNSQNQATLFYAERTDPARPGRYFWKGAWRSMRTITYRIPVKGGRARRLDVQLTVHGPIMNRKGQTVAVYWTGHQPSHGVRAMLNVAKASSFAEFRRALRDWRAPSQTFTYADDRGNIGLVAAGAYPIVARGAPWLPLAGTGESDVVGTIPFDALPQAYNPPSQMLVAANQRPVGPRYPYYIGTTLDFFDPGYRAAEIARVLRAGRRLTVADMQALQLSTSDVLAARILPSLLAALDGATLTPRQQRAKDLLAAWDTVMRADSAAATIWWTFWESYIDATFGPWWQAMKVPVNRAEVKTPLTQNLEAWTLSDQGNPAFWLPEGTRRTARQMMVRAFADADAKLGERLGPDPATWRWGRIHSLRIDALSGVGGGGDGPRPRDGDQRSVNAAGGLVATEGPSWRMVVDWGSGQAFAAYPGGQSESPGSPWYADRIAGWWEGRYDPVLDLAAAQRTSGRRAWTLAP